MTFIQYSTYIGTEKPQNPQICMQCYKFIQIGI